MDDFPNFCYYLLAKLRLKPMRLEASRCWISDAGCWIKNKTQQKLSSCLYVYPVSSPARAGYPVSIIKTITTKVLQKLDINSKILAYIDI
jgi:hypothetical protein